MSQLPLVAGVKIALEHNRSTTHSWTRTALVTARVWPCPPSPRSCTALMRRCLFQYTHMLHCRLFVCTLIRVGRIANHRTEFVRANEWSIRCLLWAPQATGGARTGHPVSGQPPRPSALRPCCVCSSIDNLKVHIYQARVHITVSLAIVAETYVHFMVSFV